ncbi:MAG TPA: hypothetical protein VIV66_15155 [Pyrinomonadaceae bacterium]
MEQRRQQQQRQQEDVLRRRQWENDRGRDRDNNWRRGNWQQDQQQRAARYQQELQRRQNLVWQRQRSLEQQRRLAQLRYQQRYLEQLRRDQLRLQQWRYNDYGPYNYRYNRGGSYYETNQYGADMLRRAVSDGYEEGFQAGQADREDGWGFNAEDAYAYQDASYGYDGYYVNLDDYQYYFREGFRRGYEDGYYRRSRYGNYSNGSFNILGTILEQILGLQVLD